MKKNFKYQVYLARNLSLIEGTTWFPHTVLTEPLCMELSLYPTFYTMAWLELRWTLENLGWQRNLFSLWRNWNKWLIEKNRIKLTKIWGKNVIKFFKEGRNKGHFLIKVIEKYCLKLGHCRTFTLLSNHSTNMYWCARRFDKLSFFFFLKKNPFFSFNRFVMTVIT